MGWTRRIDPAVGIGAVALFLSTSLVAQAQLPQLQDRVSAVDVASLYTDACAPCHGRLGDGNGRGARLLGAPQPRDFTAAVFKFRSTPTGSLPTDEDVYRTISRGVPGTWMPAWEDLLSSDQLWALVRYLKGFSEFFAEEEPESAIPIPPAPDATPEMIREGRFVYAMLGCAQCHGSLGRGDGPSADELTDDWDRKIRAYDFTRGDYKNGSSPSDVYRTLVTGLSGTPMPAFERDNVAFPGGPGVEIPAAVRETIGLEDLPALETYVTNQRTEAEIAAMSQPELEELVQRRFWALVYYVRSLNRGTGVLHWLFGENPELKAKGGGR